MNHVFTELSQIWLQILQKTLVSLRGLTFLVEKSAVRTEVLLVVPGQVPALSRSHTAAFTPNACHAHLHKNNNVIKQQAYEALGGFTLHTKHVMLGM